MPTLFASTLFISSALLFFIQPLYAKMILPRLGGTPAVWNTCMVFYQAVLLAGYTLAHLLARRLPARAQVAVHFGMLLCPALVLPLRLSEHSPPGDRNPIPWLIGLLLVDVGLPTLVLSMSAPLLQDWFSRTGHPRAVDPYFLYVASNAGSMLGLLGYPALVEPVLALRAQSQFWMVSYAAFCVLAASCGIILLRARPARNSRMAREPAPARVGPRQAFEWVVLAFAPASMLLSVTNYISTDIAAIPLLWVVPLSIYLLSFMLVFARRVYLPQELLQRFLPLVLLVLTFVMLSEATEPVGLLLAIHLVALFFVSMVCHGRLASLRPNSSQLTIFYLCMSIGGVLGGAFSSLLAPLLFNSLLEYPLVIVLACLLRPVPSTSSWHDLAWPVGLGVVMWAAFLALEQMGIGSARMRMGIVLGPAALICYLFMHHPLRFALGIAALFLAGAVQQGAYGAVVYRDRSFFGVHRITFHQGGNVYQLVHGNTVHGRQSADPERRREPLAYYHRTGPIGQVFAAYATASPPPRVAVVGLGAGSLAAYGRAEQTFIYYEIDPHVLIMARDSGYFTFLRDSTAKVEVVLGDARLTLPDAPDAAFDLLVLDAFSSDAIPMHLLTRQAIQIYLDKLAPRGVLACNISNRYLDLEPVLGALAKDRRLACWTEKDFDLTPMQAREGKSPSQWVIMARAGTSLDRILALGRWQPVKAPANMAPWTDDFSNLLGVFKWTEP